MVLVLPSTSFTILLGGLCCWHTGRLGLLAWVAGTPFAHSAFCHPPADSKLAVKSLQPVPVAVPAIKDTLHFCF